MPQVEQYVRAFEGQSSILDQHFNTVNDISPDVMGLILLRWPFPIPVVIPDNLGAIDWSTLLEHLSSEAKSGSILNLWKWIRERSDLVIVNSLKWVEKETVIADWTYTYSVLSPSSRKTTD